MAVQRDTCVGQTSASNGAALPRSQEPGTARQAAQVKFGSSTFNGRDAKFPRNKRFLTPRLAPPLKMSNSLDKTSSVGRPPLKKMHECKMTKKAVAVASKAHAQKGLGRDSGHPPTETKSYMKSTFSHQKKVMQHRSSSDTDPLVLPAITTRPKKSVEDWIAFSGFGDRKKSQKSKGDANEKGCRGRKAGPEETCLTCQVRCMRRLQSKNGEENKTRRRQKALIVDPQPPAPSSTPVSDIQNKTLGSLSPPAPTPQDLSFSAKEETFTEGASSPEILLSIELPEVGSTESLKSPDFSWLITKEPDDDNNNRQTNDNASDNRRASFDEAFNRVDKENDSDQSLKPDDSYIMDKFEKNQEKVTIEIPTSERGALACCEIAKEMEASRIAYERDKDIPRHSYVEPEYEPEDMHYRPSQAVIAAQQARNILHQFRFQIRRLFDTTPEGELLTSKLTRTEYMPDEVLWAMRTIHTLRQRSLALERAYKKELLNQLKAFKGAHANCIPRSREREIPLPSRMNGAVKQASRLHEMSALELTPKDFSRLRVTVKRKLRDCSSKLEALEKSDPREDPLLPTFRECMEALLTTSREPSRKMAPPMLGVVQPATITKFTQKEESG